MGSSGLIKPKNIKEKIYKLSKAKEKVDKSVGQKVSERIENTFNFFSVSICLSLGPYFIFSFFFLILIFFVIQLQLCGFSPHPSTPP